MKILYVTTISNTVNAFLIPHIKMLVENGHSVDIACNIVQPIKPELIDMGCKVYNIPFQRSPIHKLNLHAFGSFKNLIRTEVYDIVHTHTPVASAIVRLACKKNSSIKVIYTAHGFHFYKGAPLINWIIYYPIEWYCAQITDVLITINKEDFVFAQKKLKAKSIVYIPGVGIDAKKFAKLSTNRDAKRTELGVGKNDILWLSIGELNRNKNHEIVIRALSKLNRKDMHFAIAGAGVLENHLKTLAQTTGVAENVHILGLRSDVSELLNAADIFVHPSIREGLPIALMEAMAVGLPCIVSKIRGNIDLIDDNGGALFNPYNEKEFQIKCSILAVV